MGDMLKCGHCENTNAWELERFYDDAGSAVFCKHCQSLTPIPPTPGSKAGEYHQLCEEGTRLLNEFSFEAAMRCFRDAEKLFPGTHRALWGQISAYYGITEIASAVERRPGEAICRWMYGEKIAFEDYEAVKQLRGRIAYDIVLRQVYAEKLRALETEIRQCLAESKGDLYYDVFLLCKTTTASDENLYAMEHTQEYRAAQRIYEDFQNRGMRVFFADRSLPDDADRTDANVLSAMVRSRVMLLVSGSERNEAYLESPWIKCDWTRWISMMKRGIKGDHSLYLYSVSDKAVPYPFRMEEEGLDVVLPQGERAMLAAIEALATKDKNVQDGQKTKREKKEEPTAEPSATAGDAATATLRPKKGCRIGCWTMLLLAFLATSVLIPAFGYNFATMLPLLVIGLVVLAITSVIKSKRLGGGIPIGKQLIRAVFIVAVVIFVVIVAIGIYLGGFSRPSADMIGGVQEQTIATAQEYDFYYSIIDNSWVSIEGIRELHSDIMSIPEYIEGYPVREIAPYAFSDRGDIYDVYLPSTLWFVGEGAFCRSSIHALHVDPSNTSLSIASYAFSECYNLEYANLSAVNIASWSFANCVNLDNLHLYTLPLNLPRDAFSCCSRLGKISMDESILLSDWLSLYGEISPFAEGVDGPVYIYCWDGSYEYTVEDNSGLIYEIVDGHAVVVGVEYYESTIIVPEYYQGYPVTEIGDSAFSGRAFEVIYLPRTITRIGNDAFNGSGVREVYFPEGECAEVSIGAKAFYECKNLKWVTFAGAKVSWIEAGAFWLCTSLEYINPQGWGYGIDAYAFSGCSALEQVVFSGVLGKIDETAFNHCPSLRVVGCEHMTKDEWISLYGKSELAFAQGITQTVEVSCTDGSVFYEPPTILDGGFEAETIETSRAQSVRDQLQNGVSLGGGLSVSGNMIFTDNMTSVIDLLGHKAAIVIPEGVSVTLDLGGYTLYTEDETIAFVVYGQLEIKNGTIASRGIVVMESGNLALESVSIISNSVDGACVSNLGGSLTIREGCSLDTRDDLSGSIAESNCVYNTGYTVIHGGSFTADNFGYAIRSDSGELILYGGSVVGAHSGIGIYGGTVNIEDCYVIADNRISFAVGRALYCDGGNILIRGGTFVNAGEWAVEYTGSDGASLILQGGEFNGEIGEIMGIEKTGFVDMRSTVYVTDEAMLRSAITQGVPEIYLADNIYLYSSLVIPKERSVTLHLAGYTLDTSGVYGVYPFEIYDGASFSIYGEGGQVVCGLVGFINIPSATSCTLYMYGGHYTTMTGGTFIHVDDAVATEVHITLDSVVYVESSMGGCVVDAAGYKGMLELNVYGGSYTAHTGFTLAGSGYVYFEGASISTYGFAVESYMGAEVKLFNCSISSGAESVNGTPQAVVIVGNGGTVNVVKCDVSTPYYAAYYVTSYGGTITVSECATYAALVGVNEGGTNGAIYIDGVQVY